MAPSAGVRIEGARELRKTLKAAGEDLGDLKEAHARAGAIVAGYAATTAPHRSGRLAASIRPSGTVSASIIRAGKKSVPYAQPIHWGWPKRGIRAQPFISTAAQQTESKWVDLFWDSLLRILDKVKGDSQ